MTSISVRGLLPACAITAIAVGALALPGAANAALGTQCSGSNVTGQGASALSLAFHSVWITGFNTSSDKLACDGAQGSKGVPTVTYTNTGSGAGLESWGVNKHAANYEATNALVGTSEAPNATQKTEIEANETTVTAQTLETVPVVQFATAIIVNLPTNCKATSTSNKGRLVLLNSTLEGIWRGTITKWSEIKDGGDKLSGTGCNPESTIVHVVRPDASGPGHFLKKYLGLINGGTSFEATNVKNESVGSRTWDQVAEGPENTTWPTADAVIRPASKGEAAEDKLVSETPSSIGFGNMAEIRSSGFFTPSPGTGGPNTARFWVPIQNKTAEPITYQDPASNKDVAALAEANCAKEEYTNGEVAFPPSSVVEPWNEVTTRTVEPKYTLCGLAFVLALHSYSAYLGTSLPEATTVNNFLRWTLDTAVEKEGNKNNGGQALIKKHDYEPLVGTVLKVAQKGAALTAF
jgi:ABC-type phosphate transport system substrate-binding protein